MKKHSPKFLERQAPSLAEFSARLGRTHGDRLAKCRRIIVELQSDLAAGVLTADEFETHAAATLGALEPVDPAAHLEIMREAVGAVVRKGIEKILEAHAAGRPDVVLEASRVLVGFVERVAAHQHGAEYLTLDEAARKLGVSRRTVNRLTERARLGKRPMVPRIEVERLLAGRPEPQDGLSAHSESKCEPQAMLAKPRETE